MTDKTFEQTLQQKLETLPAELTPERDLWPGIDQAIEHQEQFQRQSSGVWTGLISSIAVIGIVSWLLIYDGKQHIESKPDLIQLANSMSRQYEELKQLLIVTYQEQPAYSDNWQQQSDELDEAAQLIKQALEAEPESVELIKMLQRVYQQQIDLIRTIHEPKQWRQIKHPEQLNGPYAVLQFPELHNESITVHG